MREIVSPLDGFRSPLGVRRGGGFSPASLFGNGLWLDRSDLSTLFQDAAGSTPVTAAGQLDALKLDKSQGLVLGPELWSNANVTTSGEATIVSPNVYRILSSAGENSFIAILNTLIIGLNYEVTFNVDSIAVGGAGLKVGDVGPVVSSLGAFRAVYKADITAQFIKRTSSACDYTISDVSFRLLPGNHATQSTAGLTSRYQVSPFGSEYDGNDDFSATPLKPTLAGTIAVRMRSDTASRVAFGSQPASNGRCYIGLASDGALAGGIGEQATGVIKGSTDIRDVWTTGILTWNGTTVSLYQDGVSVYSGAQVGAVNTTIAMHEGALNNNGTAAAFHKGRIAQSIVLDRVMTSAEIASLTNLWSTIS